VIHYDKLFSLLNIIEIYKRNLSKLSIIVIGFKIRITFITLLLTCSEELLISPPMFLHKTKLYFI